MTSQLNPAWQRKPVSSNRLAKISARFLSEGPQTGKKSGGCQVIPFLLDDPSQSWITQDLCKVLRQRGHNSLVYHLEGDDSDGRDDSPANALHRHTEDFELCLLPVNDSATLLEQQLSHVVLLVSANLDAVLTAYRRIKWLSQHGAPEIGIVMVGPRDQHAAWRYFRKLAVGTLRYLDVRLLNLGFLPEQVTPEHGPSDHHRENFLTRISERLMSSEFHAAPPLENTSTGTP